MANKISKENQKIQLRLPRPFIGLYPSCSGIVVVRSDKFRVNLMPVGLIGSPSLSPPTIGVSVYKNHYTFSLLKRYKEFTFNLLDKNLVKKTIYLGSVSGKDVDKLRKSSLTLARPKIIETPILFESPINLECKIIREIDFSNYCYFIGEIVYSHITRKYFNRRNKLKIDFEKLHPVVTLFLDFYEVKNFLGRYKAN